jgi:hypothetical protein
MQGEKLAGLQWKTARNVVTLIHRRKGEDGTWPVSIRTVNRETALLMSLLLPCCSIKVKLLTNIFL